MPPALDLCDPRPLLQGRRRAGLGWPGSMPLACGPGRDYPASSDPDADKRHLEAEHCDASVREPFIAALASVTRDATPALGPQLSRELHRLLTARR
jgi:hypothetical protein